MVSLPKLHVAVLMGGWASERPVSLMSGRGVAEALRSRGHQVTEIDMDRDVAARFRGTPGDPKEVGAEMDRIAYAREESQPLRSKTGGSTFKNPPGDKAWRLVDAAGCRGLTMGGAQVSEKHANFLINTGDATSADIEGLGEEIRRRVSESLGVSLEWEIQRVGRW